jgi:Protein of unknown function (DUF3489)
MPADLSEPQVDNNDRENASELAPAPEMRVAKGAWTRRPTSRRASRSQKQRHSATAGSKQDLVLTLLRRQSGVSIDDIVSKTHWQPHSVRGFLSAIVRKKLKLRLVSEVGKDGVHRYHVAPLKAAKPKA